jgi:hypothetical protein
MGKRPTERPYDGKTCGGPAPSFVSNEPPRVRNTPCVQPRAIFEHSARRGAQGLAYGQTNLDTLRNEIAIIDRDDVDLPVFEGG